MQQHSDGKFYQQANINGLTVDVEVEDNFKPYIVQLQEPNGHQYQLERINGVVIATAIS
jgi:hypothetical protein